jgi:putative membrane protein insertion efficiency factor
VKRLLLMLIAAYQRHISPAFPRRCKYEPTCSNYAAQAVRELGPLRGGIVAAWRVLRCNPLSNGGIDDLEDRSIFRDRHTCSQHPLGLRGNPVSPQGEARGDAGRFPEEMGV